MKEKKHRHLHQPETLSDLKARLRKSSRKVTGPREKVLNLLRSYPHPMTNKEVHEGLEGVCDLATIYRSMHLLQEMGMVKRFDFGDGIARFELVSSADEHHHHLICTECADVVEIDECFPRTLEKRIASKNGFKKISHKLEFFGVCPECQ